MATNTLLTTTGSEVWGVAANWSLGHVPQPGDDVSIVAPSSSSNIASAIPATDPAYTVASLTETTTNQMAFSETLAVSGQLTVTGATNIDTGVLQLNKGGTLQLNAVTLSNSAEILGGSGLSITSLTAGNGVIGGTVIGSASIGSISGSVTVAALSGISTIGASAGTSFFDLSGGQINLQSTSTTLADTVTASNGGGALDLQNILYQPGETYSVSLVRSSFYNVYSITLKSILGQTLYTLQNVDSVGSLTMPMPPGVTVASDGAGGTLVTLACYTAGTLIAVPGGEVPVADLAIGDLVVTASGAARPIKWIGRRSYAGRFLDANARALPIRFHAGSLGDGLPHRDLLVSPEHAMGLDGLLVPARHLVNGVSIVQERGLERVDYFHVELDSHDLILAEGAPSETFVDDHSRMMFHNASEFAALYPGLDNGPALYCAPRVEHGEALEAIRRSIDTRAGLAVTRFDGKLRGHVDAMEGDTVTGWAQNPDQPDVPVCLDVLVDGAVAARTLANRFRPDLLAAGLGSGCHSFRCALPMFARQGRIEVRRVADGATLGMLDWRAGVAA